MRAILAAVFAATLLSVVPARAEAPTRGDIQHLEREIPIRGRGNIRGRIIDPAGRGMRGVLWLCTLDGAKISQWDSCLLRDGQFFIDNVAPGRYRLHVDSLGSDVNDLEPPDDMVVEVRAHHNIHPELVARPAR